MYFAALLVISLLLGGCGVATPRPTQVTPISQSQAFDAAIKKCNEHHLIQVDPPLRVEARLMTHQQAEAILNCREANCPAATLTPEITVMMYWLVTLEGRWQLVGGPEPTRTPTGQPPFPTGLPIIFQRCRVVVDATTGEAGRISN